MISDEAVKVEMSVDADLSSKCSATSRQIATSNFFLKGINPFKSANCILLKRS